MPTATKPKPAELRTVTLTGVPVLRPGTWNGDPYTEKHLQWLIDAFEAGNAGIEPPIKLGHPPDQKLLNNSGLPAAGYVSALRMDGDVLVADIRDVPERIAALIKSKAYSKVSAEIYFDFPDGETTHPRLLKALAILGADVPAVTSLDDIEAWYGRAYAALAAQPAGNVRVYELPAGLTYNAVREQLEEEIRERFPAGNDMACFVEDFDDGFVIARVGGWPGQCYRIAYTAAPDGDLELAPEMTPVHRVTRWIPEVEAAGEGEGDMSLHAAEYKAAEVDDEAAAKRKGKKPSGVAAGGIGGQKPTGAGAAAVGNLAESDEEDFTVTLSALMDRMEARHKGGKGMPALRTFAREMRGKLADLCRKPARVAANSREDTMSPETLKLLGLDENATDAQIAEAIAGLKSKAETPHQYSADDFRALSNQVGTLTAELAQRDASAAVEAAIASGKVLPAMKEWASGYALRDLAGFRAYTAAMPAFPLGGSGATTAGSDPSKGAAAPTEMESSVAKMLGLSEEKFTEAKQAIYAGR